MAYYRRRQNKYVEKEIEREESEEIEEIQNNGYDSNDLYPTNINFIIPSKQRALRKINKAKYNKIFNKKKLNQENFLNQSAHVNFQIQIIKIFII